MKALNRKNFPGKKYTDRILQFGEGNFLRAFADWMIHQMNQKVGFDSGVTVIQPINRGLISMLNDQDGLYTVYLNGIKNGKAISEHQIIDCIQKGIDPYQNFTEYLDNAKNPDLRFVISNTTEAGIAYRNSDSLNDTPQKSFPGKLTALLYKRFLEFNGDPEKGLIHLPCELIDRNGDHLKEIILKYAEDWDLGSDFSKWINDHNIFCNTLVDRIVPGYPKARIGEIIKELNYKDNLVVEGEQFHLWVIEAPETVKKEFPSESAGLNVIFTDNMEPYRTRKVRILNGAHTSLVPVGYLYGIDNVRESVEDPVVGKFVKDAVFNEICPTLDLPQEELEQFANDVLDRFRNPYLDHKLMSISLNSVSKYKTRVLPSVLEYIRRKDKLPDHLLFSLAALIAFYKGENNGVTIDLKDDPEVLEFFKKLWQTGNQNSNSLEELTKKVLSNTDLWKEDLTKYNGITEKVSTWLTHIIQNGMKETLKAFVKN